MQELMKPKKHPWRVIKDVLFYGLIGFLTFVIIVSISIPNGLIKTIGVGWYRVKSGSMEPLIMTNDFIVGVPVDPNTLVDGDIIIFETWVRPVGSPTYIYTVVTHYFYKIDESGHVLTYPYNKKDTSENDPDRYDPWRKPNGELHYVLSSDIIGKHVATIPTAGFINFTDYLLSSPVGVGLLIVNVGLIASLVIFIHYGFKKKEKPKEIDSVVDGDDPNDNDLE